MIIYLMEIQTATIIYSWVDMQIEGQGKVLYKNNYLINILNRSIEVILLLLALKLRYPDQIHLLRGHHEDRRINKIFGFADECHLKFQEDIMDPNSIY